MANRYWVPGGTNTWSPTNTGNWSATSGGTTGASVPTSADDVFFDQAGTYTVSLSPTISNAITCRNLTVSAGTVTLNHTQASFVFEIYGNFTVLASTVCSGTGNPVYIFNNSAGTTTTFTTNGASIAWALEFNGTATSTIQLGSNLTCTSSILLQTSGRLNTTASNYAINCASFSTGNTLNNLLTLNSSTLTITSTSFFAQSSAYVSAASSTIILSGSAPSFSGGGGTYGTVSFTTTTTTNVISISGANTFTTLTIGPVSANFRRFYTIAANQTVTGTFTVNSGGTAAYGRIFILSSSPGTVRTISAGTVSLTDVDFQDITAAGASSPWSGTRLGDCLGNTNITFAAGRTVYWNNTAGAAWASTNWSDSVGGTSSVNFFPLAQDTAAFTTRPNAGQSITDTSSVNSYAVKTIDFSSRSLTLTISSAKLNLFGQFVMGSSVSFTSTSNIVLSSRSSETLDVSVGTFSSFLRIYTPSGTYTPTANFSIAGRFSLIGGTFNGGSYTFQAGGLDFSTNGFYSPALARTFNVSGSSIDLTGNNGTILDFSEATALVTYNAPRIFNLTYSGSFSTRSINASGAICASEANSITVNVTAGSDGINILSSATNYFKDLNFTGFSGSLSSGFTNIINVYGNWTNSTTMSVTGSTSTIVFAATSGIKTITSAGKSLDFNITFSGVGGTWQLQDNFTTGATKTTTLSNGTIDLQSFTLSTGLFSSSASTARTIAFGTGAITCTGTGTVWTTATTTNLTTTGTQVVNVTSAGSTAISVLSGNLSQANSISFNFTGGTYALTFPGNVGYTARSVDFTGYSGTLGATPTCSIFGDLKLSTGMTLTSSASTMTFGSTSATVRKITSSGKTLDFPVTFNGIGGSWQIQDNMTVGSTRTTTLTNGSIDLQSFTLSTGTFSSSNSNVRSVAFGTGNIRCVSTGTVWTTATATNLTTSGTQVVNVTNATATATTVSVGVMSEANAISFNFTGGTYTLSFLGATSGVRNVDFTGFSGSWSPSGSGGTIYGNLKLSTGMTVGSTANSMTFGSTSATPQTITSNGKTINWPVTFNGIGGAWNLQDAFTLGSTRLLTLTAGTINSNGFPVSTGTFSSTGSSLRAITFGGSSWAISGASWTVSGSNFSTSGSGTISMTSALAKTFAGGSFSYPTLNNGGAGALTVSGSNTFANLTNTVQPTTFTFTSGTTSTFTAFSASGTAGNLVTFGATSTTQAIWQKASGWNVGLDSVNGGNNTGLSFIGASPNYLSISYINAIVTGPSPGNFFVFF